MDNERAHRLALLGLRSRLATVFYRSPVEDPVLQQTVWNRTFPNPIGLAAGFDKNAVAFEAALDLGFGFVEVGGVTPLPQKGNPRPRLFRLEADRGVIHRMGFNNDGLNVVEARLRRRSGRGIVGVNLGKNKDQTDPTADYATLAGALARYSDFLVINVSSPNTPGLRALQSAEPLVAIIRATRGVMPSEGAPPLLIKIAPDLAADDLKEAVKAARAEKLDGIVVSNTTLVRPASLQAPQRTETGGLSGAPLFELSTRVLAEVYKLTEGTIPLIGVGGIGSGADAYAKIRAGASLVQLYSALVFEGPGLVNTIKQDLAKLLKRDGFSSVAAAVGADHR